jgi:hypothetical protein
LLSVTLGAAVALVIPVAAQAQVADAVSTFT